MADHDGRRRDGAPASASGIIAFNRPDGSRVDLPFYEPCQKGYLDHGDLNLMRDWGYRPLYRVRFKRKCGK